VGYQCGIRYPPVAGKNIYKKIFLGFLCYFKNIFFRGKAASELKTTHNTINILKHFHSLRQQERVKL
jgi:hypothetical protein